MKQVLMWSVPVYSRWTFVFKWRDMENKNVLYDIIKNALPVK